MAQANGPRPIKASGLNVQWLNGSMAETLAVLGAREVEAKPSIVIRKRRARHVTRMKRSEIRGGGRSMRNSRIPFRSMRATKAAHA
jgi:hypothetical protein